MKMNVITSLALAGATALGLMTGAVGQLEEPSDTGMISTRWRARARWGSVSAS